MKRFGWGSLCLLFLLLESCSSNKQGLFKGKTPHEDYQLALKKAGLENTQLYREWMAAAQSGLYQPLKITLPYKEAGFFPAESPQSEGFELVARKGEKIRFTIDKQPSYGRTFAELWKIEDNLRTLLYAADTIESSWEYELEEDGSYLLRIQPELLHSISYTISIETAPSLAFPVKTSANPKISSFWGDARDGGARSHEGIDIFAPRKTPALAAARGIIRRVGINNLGGKVIFLQPENKNYRLYYAHLDSQLVKEGQQVDSGDIIGLIGNTGNAQTTPPHLHFGIYSNRGAVDPFPFVYRNRKTFRPVLSDTAILNHRRRTTQKTSLSLGTDPLSETVVLQRGTLVIPLGAVDNLFKVLLPDGTKGFIKASLLTDQPLQQNLSKSDDSLLHAPIQNSAVISRLNNKKGWQVYGIWGEYTFVKNGDAKGWIRLIR